ncbi:MAG: hypothetical protein H0V60_09115 [Actinobacteria bacterium]|nr:hypothetical protein [Actinomycetota bacterium]
MAQNTFSTGAQPSRHLSVRLQTELHERLSRRAQSSGGETRSRLAARLIDEGLRMDAHPSIVFRPGPGGRRPGLAGGPDVWEIARVLRDVELAGEEAIEKTATLTGLAVHGVRAVAAYYRDYKDEVEAWIAEVDRDAEEVYSPDSLR